MDKHRKIVLILSVFFWFWLNTIGGDILGYRFICSITKMKPSTTLNVQGIVINIIKNKQEEYISLTDMLRAKDGEFFISDRLRNRNTLEFLGIWEEVNNPDFNCGEFAIIKSKAGLNSFKISIKQRVEKTNAIGIIAKSGRYGGTYAHKDIAFEFGMRISPKFKIYLIKEFQRLKQQEDRTLNRDVKRFLTKMNYKIHTDAIKENLIPKTLSLDEINYIYADEADVLNKALFGLTAKQRKEENFHKIGQGELSGTGKRGGPGSNMRDYANIEQLIVLANLESMNAQFIIMNIQQSERLQLLNQTAISQMKSLVDNTSKYQGLSHSKRI